MSFQHGSLLDGIPKEPSRSGLRGAGFGPARFKRLAFIGVYRTKAEKYTGKAFCFAIFIENITGKNFIEGVMLALDAR